MVKTRMVLFAAFVLAMAGVAALLYLAAVAAAGYVAVDLRAWLPGLPLLAMPDAALVGAAGLVALIAAQLVMRGAKARMRLAHEDRAARLRRIEDYRRDEIRIEPRDPRLEPYIGKPVSEPRERREEKKLALRGR